MFDSSKILSGGELDDGQEITVDRCQHCYLFFRVGWQHLCKRRSGGSGRASNRNFCRSQSNSSLTKKGSPSRTGLNKHRHSRVKEKRGHSGTKRGIPTRSQASQNLKNVALNRCLPIDEGGLQCFIECLRDSVPPEVIMQCIESCGSRQWANCAVCLGTGVLVVISCGVACYPQVY